MCIRDSPNTAMLSLIIVDTWQWTPFILLICLGGLASLPTEPFEAAKVDGASSWQIFTKITVPMLYPFIGLALLFRSIDAFKTFDIIYVLTSGGPGILTRTLNLYAFKHGIEYLSMGYSKFLNIDSKFDLYFTIFSAICLRPFGPWCTA